MVKYDGNKPEPSLHLNIFGSQYSCQHFMRGYVQYIATSSVIQQLPSLSSIFLHYFKAEIVCKVCFRENELAFVIDSEKTYSKEDFVYALLVKVSICRSQQNWIQLQESASNKLQSRQNWTIKNDIKSATPFTDTTTLNRRLCRPLKRSKYK